MWIALGGVALVGIVGKLNDGDSAGSLDYVHGDTFVVRSSGQSHAFPILGIEIAATEGWSYLSLRNDLNASKLTFVNESQSSIVRLRRFRGKSWPPFDAPIEVRQYDHILIQWRAFKHTQVGRIRLENRDLLVIVMAHQRNSQLNESVENLCDSIRIR